MCQRYYKRKFQQPNPCTDNSGDASDADISVNRQRQVPRTGTAQWQDPGDVSCDATQVPMIQKVQKTAEILQFQFIDHVG